MPEDTRGHKRVISALRQIADWLEAHTHEIDAKLLRVMASKHAAMIQEPEPEECTNNILKFPKS